MHMCCGTITKGRLLDWLNTTHSTSTSGACLDVVLDCTAGRMPATVSVGGDLQVAESTPFAPLVRKEIGGFAWHLISELPGTKEQSAMVTSDSSDITLDVCCLMFNLLCDVSVSGALKLHMYRHCYKPFVHAHNNADIHNRQESWSCIICAASIFNTAGTAPKFTCSGSQ